jgi:hypothetical protein
MKVLLALVAILPLGAAHAQSFDPRAQAQADSITQARITNLESSQRPRADRLECLTRISDQRTICHTRAEWQAIARKLDSGIK